MRVRRPGLAAAVLLGIVLVVVAGCNQAAGTRPSGAIVTGTPRRPSLPRTSTAVVGVSEQVSLAPTATQPATATGEPSATEPATATSEPSTPTSEPSTATGEPASAATEPATEVPAAAPTATASPTPAPAPLPIFGVEMQQISQEHGLSLAQGAGVYWLRHNGLLWAKVEPTAGERRWKAMADLEAQLRAAYEAELHTILIVRQTPDWAEKVPGHSCGAVAPEALDALAQFLSDAVARYKDPPYGVKYWELWNEPDVDPLFVVAGSPYGCWGDQEDPTYGGGYYAQMLRVAYPAIKAADPEAQVLVGGLLLDKDPALDPAPNPPGRFLEGILQAGGGDYLDIVSFHAYTYYDGQLRDWEQLGTSWTSRGGGVAGKVDFLREVLARYGYDKSLMLTESGLLCPQCSSPPSEAFLEAQAAYVLQLYARNMALGLGASIWYPFDGPGWRQAALLDAAQQPRPSYQAYRVMTSKLLDAQALGPVDGLAGLIGYAFQRPGGELWVLWSPDGAPVAIPGPAGLAAATDLMGNPLAAVDQGLEIGFAPVYFEFSAR
jgi:hypothetical protein